MNRVIFLMLLVTSIISQAQHSIRLKSNKFIRNVTYIADNGSWISYQDKQTMHDLLKSKIEYLILDSVYRFYKEDGSYYDKSRYPAKSNSTSSSSSYYVPRSKPLSDEQKLHKNFSSGEKFSIGVGQVFIGGGMAIAGTLVGTVVGGIGGLIAAQYTTQPRPGLSGVLIGTGVGFSLGAASGISLMGKAGYGAGAFKGSAVGAVLGGGAGAAMIAAEYVNTGHATFSVPFALLTPIIGGMVGYYQQLNIIRASKVKTTFHTNGSTAGLTFKF